MMKVCVYKFFLAGTPSCAEKISLPNGTKEGIRSCGTRYGSMVNVTCTLSDIAIMEVRGRGLFKYHITLFLSIVNLLPYLTHYDVFITPSSSSDASYHMHLRPSILCFIECSIITPC